MKHVNVAVSVDNPMNELRNRAVHANHLHGEDWEKKKERKKTIFLYTGCHRRNGPNFGRVFLMLNYTDITQNTYIQS